MNSAMCCDINKVPCIVFVRLAKTVAWRLLRTNRKRSTNSRETDTPVLPVSNTSVGRGSAYRIVSSRAYIRYVFTPVVWIQDKIVDIVVVRQSQKSLSFRIDWNLRRHAPFERVFAATVFGYRQTQQWVCDVDMVQNDYRHQGKLVITQEIAEN